MSDNSNMHDNAKWMTYDDAVEAVWCFGNSEELAWLWAIERKNKAKLPPLVWDTKEASIFIAKKPEKS